ncbi:MAG: type I-E CRISPR-associated protein Cas7/Cse4/CasC [Aquabacterium sp.]|nr:type I-E CRISPR-associated protein Cas7/Cse4/CasC [Aquabacterium sp.]
MSLFVEYHLIQNFVPSNLNRDDTGAPKDALFGGHRRARVSSQCFKRAVRDWFRDQSDLSPDVIGSRTLHLDRLLAPELEAIGLADRSKFNEIVKLALKKKAGKDKSEGADDGEEAAALSYLMFISPAEIAAMSKVIATHVDAIKAIASKKKPKPTDVPDDLRTAIKNCLHELRSVDIALFGRMLADLPAANQHAACQVAHSISTHRVEREFDYFTAVDDKATAEETGAPMVGSIEFNSATFYRYASLDANKLQSNLQGDRDLTLAGLRAFTQALALAIPSGKQNTFAANNPPSFIGVVLRHASPFNLANAYEKPIWANRQQTVTAQSVQAMAAQERQLATAYGDARDRWAFLDLTDAWPEDLGERQASLGALTDWVVSQVGSRLGATAEA